MAQAKLQAKVVMLNVPSRNLERARKFYSSLLGSDDFVVGLNEAVPSFYRPISEDGLNLMLAHQQDDRERVTAFFAVDDLDEMVKQLQDAGGQLIVAPRDVLVSGSPKLMKAHEEVVTRKGQKVSSTSGRMATMIDSEGNYIGLMQLEGDSERYFKAGKHQRPLSKETVSELDEWKKVSGTARRDSSSSD